MEGLSSHTRHKARGGGRGQEATGQSSGPDCCKALREKVTGMGLPFLLALPRGITETGGLSAKAFASQMAL